MNFKLYFRWWQTWKGIPVLPWVRAAAYYKAGNFERAAELYELGLHKHTSHSAHYCARLDLAHCYFRLHKFDAAERNLKYVVTKLPRSREGHKRLAKLYLWTGRSLDAAWTLKRATREIPGDAKLAALFLFSVLENGGPSHLMKDAVDAVLNISEDDRTPLIEAVRARVALEHSSPRRKNLALDALIRCCDRSDASLESLVLLADYLVSTGELEEARKYLRRAIAKSPSHPRSLSLLAITYLRSGESYNAEYGLQLALSACQNSSWLSPREMHALAEAYYHNSDKMAALIVASKAKEEGTRLLGAYRDSEGLERLIEDLASGTLA